MPVTPRPLPRPKWSREGSQAGRAPAAFQRDLDPTDDEVEVGGTTYGPGPGVPVPWPAVAAWVRGHPAAGLLACGVDQGWTLAALRVHGGGTPT